MMKLTTYWMPYRENSGLSEAAAVLAAGGIVAFPTETVYGLGGDARSTEAVERIFTAKGRPSDNPLIVHLADASQVDELVAEVLPLERTLMAAFWPGPLTLVLPVKAGTVSTRVTAGLNTVAVRVPAHPLAQQLIAAAGCPIAAPSANRSGRPSPTLASHVREDLDGRIDGLVDGGPTGVGLESTVVRVLDGAIHILRPGGVTAAQMEAAAGPHVRVLSGTSENVQKADRQRQFDVLDDGTDDEPEAPRSPGVKYTHYAPKGEMILVQGEPQEMRAALQAALDKASADGLRTGVLTCDEHAAGYCADAVLALGPREEPAAAAQELYAALRECDARGVQFIAAEAYPEDGIGAALMNRLRKAAGGRILQA